jgi:hypothetical protein
MPPGHYADLVSTTVAEPSAMIRESLCRHEIKTVADFWYTIGTRSMVWYKDHRVDQEHIAAKGCR